MLYKNMSYQKILPEGHCCNQMTSSYVVHRYAMGHIVAHFLVAKAPLQPLDEKEKVKVKMKVKVKGKKLRNSMILPKFLDDGK